MPRRLVLAAILAVSAGRGLQADVTIRRSMSVSLGPTFPVQLAEQTNSQLASALPSEIVVRVKGDKSYSSAGPLIAITDYATGRVTLLNPKTKQFATAPLTEYLDRMAAATQAAAQGIPAEAQQLLRNMKFDSQTKKTGRAAVIQGIRAEESVITFSLGMPVDQTFIPAMRMELHCWIAPAAEIARVSGLKQLAALAARDKGAVDPTQALQRVLLQMPGFGELRKPLSELTAGTGNSMLRMTAAVYIPALAQVEPPSDPTIPVEEIKTDLLELSTAPLDDSIFEVPAEYRSALLQDLIQVLLPAPSPTGR
ncbi:MAG TPA: hypothetical protein VGN17_17980 [Bryobacteraceae bacterium]|jgi:hypothetical protein